MTSRDRPPYPYNPSLDGIRALAVTAVLLYHGGSTSGGFLGVDVFFVLSGFLIASLLIAELHHTGRLSLGGFWARRIRRLLPALVTVVLFVAIAFPLLGVAMPSSLHWDLASTLTYTSNWWFIVSGQAYGAIAPTPVLHSWSLAIEEQWYLLFPLMLLAAFVAFGRRMGPWLGPLLLLGAGVSAAWTAWLAHSGASLDRIYFGTDTRVQGLLLGAAVAAFLAIPQAPWRTSDKSGSKEQVREPFFWPRIRGIAGWGALIGLGVMVSGTTISDQWLPRGGFLVVAALAALVILSVAPTPAPWSPAPLLSLRPLVAVGLISYGLYLWHFPVYMLMTGDTTGLSGLPLLVVRVLVTGALSIASYLLIEQPIRRGGLWAAKPVAWTRVTGLGVVAALALGVALVRLPASYDPDYLGELRTLAGTSDTAPTPVSPTRGVGPAGTGPHSSYGSQPNSSATAAPLRSILLVGDSVALSLLPAARADGSVTVNIATRFGCGTVPFDAIAEGVLLRPEEPLCSEWEANRAKEIAAQPADVGVLILGPWEQYDRWIRDTQAPFGGVTWTQATVNDYRRVIDEMTPHVERIAVILNHCRGAPDADLPIEMMYRSGRFAPVVNDVDRVNATNEALRQAIMGLGMPVQVLDLDPLLCQDGYSREVGGVSLHTDGVHFTEPGAALVWDWILPQLKGRDS